MPASNDNNLAQTVASISASLVHIEKGVQELKERLDKLSQEARELRESLIEVRTKQSISSSFWALVTSAAVSVGVALVIRLFNH